MLAVRLGIPPSVLWEQEPRDLATILAVLLELGEDTGDG